MVKTMHISSSTDCGRVDEFQVATYHIKGYFITQVLLDWQVTSRRELYREEVRSYIMHSKQDDAKFDSISLQIYLQCTTLSNKHVTEIDKIH